MNATIEADEITTALQAVTAFQQSESWPPKIAVARKLFYLRGETYFYYSFFPSDERAPRIGILTPYPHMGCQFDSDQIQARLADASPSLGKALALLLEAR